MKLYFYGMLKTSLLRFLFLACTLAVYSKVQCQEIQSNTSIAAQFQQLNKGISVLYIAAHPDDENTQLLTFLTKGETF